MINVMDDPMADVMCDVDDRDWKMLMKYVMEIWVFRFANSEPSSKYSCIRTPRVHVVLQATGRIKKKSMYVHVRIQEL